MNIICILAFLIPISRGECPFQLKNVKFNGYDLIVEGVNESDQEIFGGYVNLKVEIKVIFWINAHECESLLLIIPSYTPLATDPTCSFEGTDCKDGIILGKEQL